MRPLSYSFLAVFLLILGGCASSQPAYYQPLPVTVGPSTQVLAPSAMWDMPRTLTHEVGPAETLWRISKIYGVDMDSIMRANRLSDPTKIKNGQKLTIPGARAPRPVIPLYPTYRWTHIVVHHTVTEEGNARSIDSMHVDKGWSAMGYHFLVDNGSVGKFDGQIEVGPRWIKQQNGAHCNANGMNEKGIGIALIGNFSEGVPTARQLESLVYLVKSLQRYYDIPYENVIGHRDVPGKNTECPGTHFPWAEFKSRL